MGIVKLLSIGFLVITLFMATVVLLLANRTRPIGLRLVDKNRSPGRRVDMK